MGWGWSFALVSRTQSVKPVLLGVAPCGQTVTKDETLKGKYDVVFTGGAAKAYYLGPFSAGFRIGYSAGIWLQFHSEVKELHVSHTCTGGPGFQKQIQVDVNYETEIWNLLAGGSAIATITLENPIDVKLQRCVDWIPCGG